MVKQKELMIIAHYSEETLLSLDEVCDICGVSPAFIEDIIDHGIIHPHYYLEKKRMFSLSQLQRIKITQRIQKDLEINLAGCAVILELLEEIAQLREKSDLLDKYFR